MNKDDRKKLKAWARNTMQKNYWKSVLASLIFSGVTFFFLYFLIYGVTFAVGYLPTFGAGFLVAFLESGSIDEEAVIVMIMMLAIFSVMGLIFFAIGAAGKFFLANPLEMGCKKYFIDSLYKESTKLGEIGTGFNNNYKNIAKTLCVRDIYIGLWSALSMTIYMIFGMVVMYGGIILLVLYEDSFSGAAAVLFIIALVILVYIIYFAAFTPLYIKMLHYLFIPYILAENPDMPRKQVFELSKQMIQGNKKSVFVMHLSFLGWFILSGCTCGILHAFYVGPYIEYTTAAYYKTLQQKRG